MVKAKGNNIQKKYAKLYEENSDFVGWIKIKGTKINYPVMKTTKPYDFYLMHNFKKRGLNIWNTICRRKVFC